MNEQSPIMVETTISAPIETIWQAWTAPEHITHWAFASDDWEARAVENDVRVGGTFKTVMAAKDGSASFDFAGTYTVVTDHQLIEYDMSDGRHVRVVFADTPQCVQVTETFDPESENPAEMQRAGWQAILDNFAAYVKKSGF